MKKLLSVSLAITTILWLVGTYFVYAPIAKAAVVDGDVVSPDATFVDADGNTYYPYDVFIVKIVGSKTFKRLVLNPQVFDSYGHLKWSNIKKISAATVAGYTTSSLVREINDTKVYKLIPDGDTGTKQWVETLDCFTSKGYDWDSVYIINATDRDNYTTGATICGGGVEGAMTLSLASDTTVSATLPVGVQGVAFLKVNVTGTGTISQLTVERKGAGEANDFANVYVYENNTRLTSGRSISSATSKVTFINLNLQAPTTFSIVGDLDATNANAGNVNYFAIGSASDVTANATVGGTFPISGNPMGTATAAIGTVTIARSGATAYNVTVGAKEAEISAFKLSINTESAYVHRVQLFNAGDVTNEDITNLKLKDNSGVLVATDDKIAADGYVTFALTSPYYIKKGGSEIFHVYADIGGVKPERTIMLYLELETDVLAIGTTYGFGMRVSDKTAYDNDTHIDVTCKGGDLTLNKLGPGAKNIGTDTDDTVFLQFSMTAAADITIKKTRLTFCWDNAGNGVYDALTTTLGGGTDLEDIKLVDKDSGTVYAGPVDGSDFDTATHANACPGDVTGVYEQFSDTFDISAGETLNLQITGDVKTANTDVAGETDLVSGDKIKFVLYNWPQWIGVSGNIDYVKYTTGNDAVDDSAIAPSSNIAGDEMTIQSAALVITLAASPSGTDATERKFVLGQNGIDITSFVFSAGEASDITVTNLTITGYVDEGDDDTFEPGLAGTNYVKDTLAALQLWEVEGNTKIADTKGWSGTDYQDMAWSGLNWKIPAGESRTLLVKGDISSAGKATGSEADESEELGIDIPDVSADISANDKDGNDLTATGDAVNMGGTAGGCLAACNPGVNISVIDKGTLTFAAASDTQERKLIAMGTTNNEVSKFKLTGTNEAFLIEKFSVDLLDDAVVSTAFRDDFSSVKLKYQTETQWGTENWTISTGKTFADEATLSFSFSGSDRPYIPKNDDTYITTLVDIVDYSGGEGADSTDWFKIAMTDDTDDFDEFKALGSQSNKYVSASEPTQTDFYTHWIVRSYPFVEKVAWSGDELELARFSVTAVGGDVVFGYDAADRVVGLDISPVSSALQFDVISSGTDDSTSTLYLYDWNNNIVASTGAVGLDQGASTSMNDDNGAACTEMTTISFNFDELSADLTITKGATKTFYVLLDAGDLPDFDHSDEYIYLKWVNTNAGQSATVSGGGVSDNFDLIYWDKSDDEAESREVDHAIGVPGSIKNTGSFPISFRTLRGTLNP